MTATPLTVVSGDQALAEFRRGLTGERAFELIEQAGGRLLVQLAVGVGKSEWLARIIEHALTVANDYDLVVVLLPRRDILHEIRQRLPQGLSPVILNPRPRRRCGDLDADWSQFEKAGCGLLGREVLCRDCPCRPACRWPDQYTRLRGVRLILATQQHVVNNPHFVTQLRHQARAERVLTLLDESDLLLRRGDRTICRHDLDMFIAAQEAALSSSSRRPSTAAQQWLGLSRLLTQARSTDLCNGHWSAPWVDADWAVAVQRMGRQQFGPGFRFIGYELQNFAASDSASRERRPNGDIRFAVPPSLGRDFIIFSSSIARDLARYRLDPNHDRPTLVSPFEHFRFENPDTRWYNISALIGAASYFPKNAAAILDFFAAKIARNIEQGKRTLLITRKKFRGLIRRELQDRLARLGLDGVTVVTGNWRRHDLQVPRTLPLISYGISGVNLFQHCEAAYCLNGFYITAAIVADTVHDIDATSDRFPIRILSTGNPRRRRVRADLPAGCATILPRIAQGVFDQKESDVVVQAVGRVRPFTRPREVITFQAGTLPGVDYSHQFENLAQIRTFFDIPTARASRLIDRVNEAGRLRREKKTPSQIANIMGASLSAVKRYLRQSRGS